MRGHQWAILIAGGILAAAMACSRPTKVVITPKQFTLFDSGATKVLIAQVLDQKDRGMEKVKVVFKSSAPEIAEVDGGGKVTAKRSGEATITANVGKITGQAKAVIRLISSLKIALPEGGANGTAGSLFPLQVSGVDERGDPADLHGISFTSSEPGVAAVDKEGRLTLLSSGKTKIMASLGKQKAQVPVEVHVCIPMAIKVPTPAVQTIVVGETARLDVTVLSDLGEPMKIPLICTSSSDQIATADASGNLKGVGRGTAEITVTAGNARNVLKVIVR